MVILIWRAHIIIFENIYIFPLKILSKLSLVLSCLSSQKFPEGWEARTEVAGEEWCE